MVSTLSQPPKSFLRYIDITESKSALRNTWQERQEEVIQEIVCLGDCMSQMSALSGNLFILSTHWRILPTCASVGSPTAVQKRL